MRALVDEGDLGRDVDRADLLVELLRRQPAHLVVLGVLVRVLPVEGGRRRAEVDHDDVVDGLHHPGLGLAQVLDRGAGGVQVAQLGGELAEL